MGNVQKFREGNQREEWVNLEMLLQRGQGRNECPVLHSKSCPGDPEEEGLECGAGSRCILGEDGEAQTSKPQATSGTFLLGHVF